jgi:hypothetical protein
VQGRNAIFMHLSARKWSKAEIAFSLCDSENPKEGIFRDPLKETLIYSIHGTNQLAVKRRDAWTAPFSTTDSG